MLKMVEVKEMDDEKYIAYSTSEKVVGLIKLPIDGNPNKTIGLIAHPKAVADVCCSSDGKYMFSCGGTSKGYSDFSVAMWEIDVLPIEQAVFLGGEGVEPFISLIDGGRDGNSYKDMQDFFFYSQIRSKDENTTKVEAFFFHFL